ncbi:MAG: ZIP family metal transporter [Planctomycetota bacterium]|nr:ZIP family metal transporter [Planctomycetota bacterium]
MVGTVALWMLLPLGVTVLGGLAAIRRPPGPRLTSGLQHFAAGIVIAAVCTEVVPEAIAKDHIWSVIVGFVIGVVLVMAVRELSGEGPRRSGRTAVTAEDTPGVSLGMIVTTGIDLFIDGLLVGLGFTLATASGELLVIAVTFEVLFIAMSLAATMRSAGSKITRVLVMLCVLGLLVLLGGVLGTWVLVGSSSQFLAGLAAFATAALLYLVVEELLVEAHERGETTMGSLMFFIGFGASLVLAMVLG